MCLRLYRKRRTLAVVLEKLPPDAFVLLTALHGFNRLFICWSLQTRTAREIQVWGPRCEEDCIHRWWHPSCWFLKTAYFSASHDANCCANQVLVTEGVTSLPEACYPWLQKLIDISSWTASENFLTQRQDFFSLFLCSSHIVSSENPCSVSDRPRKHWRVCCHLKGRDFVFENCQKCSNESTHWLCESWSNRDHPVELLTRAPSLLSVYQD